MSVGHGQALVGARPSALSPSTRRQAPHRCVRAMGVCGVWMRYILLSVRCVSAWVQEEAEGRVGW